jgi:Secretion system C-terminal sorting domain
MGNDSPIPFLINHTHMRYTFVLLMFLLSIICRAQLPNDGKRDFQWRLGFDCYLPTEPGGGINMDFNSGALQTNLTCPSIGFDMTNASICDTSGQLILTSNGYRVSSANGTSILGGEWFAVDSAILTYGRRSSQAALILPFPCHPNQYVLLNMPAHFDTVDQNFHVFAFYANYINMNANGGHGLASPINQEVVRDTFFLQVGSLTANRHANGRDWWILVPKSNSNIIYRFLLDSTGVYQVGTQQTGYYLYEGVSASYFSPDGSMFAHLERNNRFLQFNKWGWEIYLHNFDRCTGLLSNTRSFLTATEPFDAWFNHVAFSPNNELLYATTDSFLIQYDISRGANIFQHSDTVGRAGNMFWQGFYQSVMQQMQLAPDGKIYISSFVAPNLHVIDHPNVRGIGCGFREWGIQLPVESGTMANYPNFRLGREVGSGCDTIYNSVSDVDVGGVKVYPNPTSSHISIEWDGSVQPTHFIIRDLLGREVSNLPISHQVSLDGLQNGMYFVSIYKNEVGICVRKVVVQR